MDEAMNRWRSSRRECMARRFRAERSSIRAVLPWKYGYKGAKSIERIEFIAKEPATFWNDFELG